MFRIFDKGQGLRAFSLPEMLVVLVIIGILVLIALPNLMPLISKTPRAALQYNVKAYGLTKQEARVMEQLLINKYGLENLYNKINSIAPKFCSSYNIY